MTKGRTIQDDDLISVAGGNSLNVDLGDGGDGDGDGGRTITPQPPDHSPGGGGPGVEYDRPAGGSQDKNSGLGD
jgi:hypothetical protein